MITAIKEKDKILVGASLCDGSVDMSEKDLALAENIPFWKVKGTKDCYVGTDNLSYAADLLRFHDSLFLDVTDAQSLITNVVPKMKALLEAYDCIIDEKKWDNELLVIKGGAIYKVCKYFTVTEEEETVALGGYSTQYLEGALEENRDLPPLERLLASVRSTNRMRNRTGFPLVVFDLETKKRRVVYR